MKDTPKPSGHQPENVNQDAVQGEGDYKSAKTYGKVVRSFAKSGRVGEAVRSATVATPQEQEELLKAERIGLSHSKGEDPAFPLGPARKPGGGNGTLTLRNKEMR